MIFLRRPVVVTTFKAAMRTLNCVLALGHMRTTYKTLSGLTTEHIQDRRLGSSTRGLADCVRVVSIGAVPASVLILYVGVVPGDPRQKAEKQK